MSMGADTDPIEHTSSGIRRDASGGGREQPPAGVCADEGDASFDNVLLLALSPLLAASETVVQAVGLGVAALCILPLASVPMLLVRRGLDEHAAVAAAVLLLSGMVACAELTLHAWLPDLRQALGVFLPLLCANLIILTQLRERAPPLAVLRTAIKLGATVLVVLLALAVPRELVGRGSLLHDAARLLSELLPQAASGLAITVFRLDMGFLLAMLPSGAFIAFGVLLALRNWLLARRKTARTIRTRAVGQRSTTS